MNAAELYQTVTDDERQRRQVEKDTAIQQRVINYFNFDNYSEGELNHLARNLMENQKKSISINEALSAARFAPDNTYIVILKRNKVVCHVGKTEHPLSYIGLNHKKVGADSAYFDCIDPSYADDVIIELKVFYDLALDKIRPSLVNRKFATLKQAIFAYKTSDNISRKKILSTIESSKMRTIDLGNEHILIDKIALHKALYHPRSI